MHLNHSVVVKVFALVLLCYGAYSLWLVVKHQSFWFLLWSVPSIAGAIGLAMSRTWSQYLYYVIAFCTAAGWAWFVVIVWPSLTAKYIVNLLVLGAVLVPFCVWSSLIVFRYFRANTKQIQQNAPADAPNDGAPLS